MSEQQKKEAMATTNSNRSDGTAVSLDDTAAPKASGRGPKWVVAEDMELCKGWIATSEDATVGANQKGATFKAKFLLNYTHLLKEYNKTFGTKHSVRTAGSCFNRFGRLSRLVLKFLAIEEQMGKPPSGDTDRKLYDTKCKDVFLQRHSDAANILDSVLACKVVLGEHPKWKSYQIEEDADSKKRADTKKARPQGSKKAKQMEEDRKMVEQILTSSKAAPKVSPRDEILKQIGSGFEAITDGKSSCAAMDNTIDGARCLISSSFFLPVWYL